MLTEKELQRVWALGLFRRGGLRTEDGRAVEVRFPGFAAAGGGPDFTSARLLLGGEERRGDVELHLTPSGWRAHGHGAEGAYANVILHVALRRDPFPSRAQTLGGRAVAELVLEPYLEASEVELRRLLAGPGRPPPGREAAWLERLGDLRFERLASRAARSAARIGADEALYREVMTGLGYRLNKAPFAELARLVPWSAARGRPAEEAAGRLREAALRLPWRLAGVRPANHPSRRIEGAALFLASLGDRGLVDACRAAEDPVPFFDPARRGLIGAGRALALWTTAVLPALGDRAAFTSWPALAANRRSREAAQALGVSEPRTLRGQWGLYEARESVGA